MKTSSFALSILLLLGVAAACSSDTSGNGDGAEWPDICRDNPFDEHCGQECVSSVDCGPNLYCGPDKTCRADCTPGGGECGPNAFCTDHGHCTEECASVSVELEHIIPTVMLLIDQSGSMSDDFGGTSRWQAMRAALADPQQGVVYQLQDEIIFGAALYTSDGGFAGGDCPILQKVAPALHNAQAIGKLIGDNGPQGDTPTGESITAVVSYLDGLPPDSITPLRIIVLATDGEPDTCEVPNPQTGQPQAVAAAQAAFSAGVKTFILSVGSDVAASHLQDMANAGAGLDVGGGQNAPYYVANDPEQLRQAFEQIAQGSRSCLFALEGEVQPIEYAAYGKVVLNGRELEFQDPDGWRLADAGTLELLGSACREYLDTENPTLEASFPCGAVYVP
ncbi:MAG: hypothetical protein DRI34_09325 [Deltaproteobacteria bacterium]|nr:MAG: hypothetical protein DRI34_09325 [Deltaproteobacteria bacterium]